MRIVTRFVICAVLLAVPAAEAKNVKSADFTAADAGQKALVLWSTSADRTSLSSGTGLLLKHAVVKGDEKKWKQVGAFYLDNPFLKSHSSTSHMNVHWRALEPGEYLLERWLVNPYGCFAGKLTFRFTLAAGAKLYLGEFRLEAGSLDVRDAYQRDYEYFNANAHGHKPDSFTVATPVREIVEDETCNSY